MAVTFETSYQVGKDPVTLSIIIGDAQLGDSIVRLGKTVLGQGDIENLPVGKGPALAGKTLNIKSVVTDVSDKTNRTSIRYALAGGTVPGTFDLNAMVSEEGASIIYRTQIHFE